MKIVERTRLVVYHLETILVGLRLSGLALSPEAAAIDRARAAAQRALALMEGEGTTP